MELLLEFYFESLSRTRREGLDRRDPLYKTLEAKVFQSNAVMKVDLDWSLLQILKYDANSGLNFPKQFYLAADVRLFLILD